MTITVRGKTFHYRETLKAMGGRWDADNHVWKLPAGTDTLPLQGLEDIYIENDKPRMQVDPVQVDPVRVDPVRVDKTIFVGDDQSLLGKLTNVAPRAFFGFSSLAKMVEYVNSIGDVYTGSRARGYDRESNKWFGTENMNDACNLAINGWEEGVEIASKINDLINSEHAVNRVRIYSIAGGRVNVGRMLSGSPNHMISRRKKNDKKIITIYVETFMSAIITVEQASIRAASVASVVDILEKNGYSCEVVSVSLAYEFPSKEGYQVHLSTRIKNAGEKLSMNDLVFSLGHPSYLRRLVFAAIASVDELQSIWRGSYGYPMLEMTETNANEFYIGRIDFKNSKIGKFGTLHEKAIQMLNFVLPPNLPITINME